MEMYWKYTHPQAIKDVDKFVSSSEQVWREIYHYITCSAMDPLQWMGAVRMRVQTADKKHHNNNSIHSINVLWSENLHICKKQIHN